MIELQNFSIGYRGNTLVSCDTARFTPGTLTALIGRNGTGKSTLLRAIAGLSQNYTGTIAIDSRPLKELSPRELAHTVAFVSTARIRPANLPCSDVVALGRSPYTGWSGSLSAADRRAVSEALAMVDMADYATRFIDTLSDGEYQRIMIARAIAQDTHSVLLDEPTSFLDLPNRYALCRLLAELAHKHHKTILFSTHELDLALEMTDEIAFIDNRTLHTAPSAEMRATGYIQSLFNL